LSFTTLTVTVTVANWSMGAIGVLGDTGTPGVSGLGGLVGTPGVRGVGGGAYGAIGGWIGSVCAMSSFVKTQVASPPSGSVPLQPEELVV
jgi:hypothetical protein